MNGQRQLRALQAAYCDRRRRVEWFLDGPDAPLTERFDRRIGKRLCYLVIAAIVLGLLVRIGVGLLMEVMW